MKPGNLIRDLLIGVVIASATLPSAEAAPIRWQNHVVHIDVQGKNLTDVLRDFTASQGVTASIAKNVTGTVSGQFDMTPQRFLDTLASTFGFVWFFDGNILSISNANDVTRQVIRLSYASPRRLISTLHAMRLDDPRFAVTYDNAAGTVLVNGPPDYVQIVQSIAQKLDDSENRNSGSVVRVFKLQHAWSADHKVKIDGDTVTVQGVASVLSSLYHPQSKGGSGRNGAPSGTPNMQRVQQMSDAAGQTTGGGMSANGSSGAMPPLPPGMAGGGASGGSSGGETYGSMFNGSASGGGTSTPTSNGGAFVSAAGGASDTSLPVIEADPITNAVLIRDVPQRIDQYASLIHALDVRPKVIEIEAHIIEIDDNFLKQLGINWHYQSGHVDVETGADTTTVSTGSSDSGNSTTTLSASSTSGLLARIQAVKSNTLAKIDATPRIATLDNVEAVMDNKTQFFVRVSGYTSADLYSISTGVSLRVLPMVVHEDGRDVVKMIVHIEDGQIASGQTVDTLPVITSSDIDTQALVGQGDSLLIAGYNTDATSNGVTSVPGISKVPLLGALFRAHDDSRSHLERVFLLTPRVIRF